MALGVSPTLLPCIEPGAGVSRRGTSNICRRPSTLQRTAGTEPIRRQLDIYRWSVSVQGSQPRPDTAPRSGFPAIEVGKDQRVRGFTTEALQSSLPRAERVTAARSTKQRHTTLLTQQPLANAAQGMERPKCDLRAPPGPKPHTFQRPRGEPPGTDSFESSPRTGCRGGLRSLPLGPEPWQGSKTKIEQACNAARTSLS